MATARHKWKMVGGKWTCSLGHRGQRVRLFEKRRGGSFYREVWIAGRGRDQACLWTVDRQEAERLGRQFLAALLAGSPNFVAGGPLTLGDLWTKYSRECASFVDNKPDSKADAASRVKTLIGHFGKECDVRNLDARDQAAYVKARRSGGITMETGTISRPVNARSVEADLVLLHGMLSWATTVRLPGGGRLLEHHPLAGVKRPHEENPTRPVATWERFEATRGAMHRLAAESKTEAERIRWVKMELALVLAEATGRRLGSIRQLRWEDVNFQQNEIHWRAEADKKGQEWFVPMPPRFAETIRSFQRRLGAVGGNVFGAEKNSEVPMDRHLFDKWLSVAEREAKLVKLKRGLWHPYRRKWATERKHLSIKDVAAVGGWKDTETLLRCYQAPDSETLLAVMAEERKLHEVGGGV